MPTFRVKEEPERSAAHQEILPGLHRFADTCNVYVVCGDNEAIAIDFGSGRWLPAWRALGLPPIRRVYLTHHHSDQCAGLLEHYGDDFEIHAPVGEEEFYTEEGLRAFHEQTGGEKWFPRRSYDVLPRGLPPGRVRHDLAGFSDHYWGKRRLRFLSTPGHGAHAISILLDHAERQVVFCGDAAHAGGTLHQPYHLEWDHWSASGALAAWQGVERLASLDIDVLLPAHGPAITRHPRRQLALLSRRLRNFIIAKGSICRGERDCYLVPRRVLKSGAIELLPNFFWFHNGGYLLVAASGEGLITDPHGDLTQLKALLRELPDVRVTAQLVTHIHSDHMSGVEQARTELGARLWLHPWVAEILQDPIRKPGRLPRPFVTRTPVHPDGLWPEHGEWAWNEFTFRIAPMPGQTWWHCGFMTVIERQRVLFGGDTFQPASRWNGTGGFCSINDCRFREGFLATAEKILQWQPNLIVNGHSTWRHFRPSYFRKVRRWAERAEAATRDLCPSGNLYTDYYLHSVGTDK